MSCTQSKVMTELQEGDTVFLVTDQFEIKEVKYFGHCYDEEIWVVDPEDWRDVKMRDDMCYLRQHHQWRPTRIQALGLLRQKLKQRWQHLKAEIESVEEYIDSITEELNQQQS